MESNVGIKEDEIWLIIILLVKNVKMLKHKNVFREQKLWENIMFAVGMIMFRLKTYVILRA